MQPSATGHPSTSRAELSKEGGVSAPAESSHSRCYGRRAAPPGPGVSTAGRVSGEYSPYSARSATLEADCGISGQSRRSTDCSAPGRPPSEPAGQGGGRTCASSVAIYPPIRGQVGFGKRWPYHLPLLLWPEWLRNRTSCPNPERLGDRLYFLVRFWLRQRPSGPWPGIEEFYSRIVLFECFIRGKRQPVSVRLTLAFLSE